LWFSRTDSKSLLSHLSDLYWKSSDGKLLKIQDHLSVDLVPLSKIASEEDESFESFIARDPTPEREEYWHKMHAEYEAAWQDPEFLANVIESLLPALEKDKTIYASLGIEDDYFIDGFFEQDMKDLHTMFRWAVEQGIDKVRLVAS
jgi:hypothetical protein